jgi:very-short-patch-repair endonuclease
MANERARALRKSMTPQEVKLWVHLRTWRSHGFHFRRQSPRNGFILDFMCLKQRLIVEVDGGQHNLPQHASRDQRRDMIFSSDGFRILRFWNSEIDENLDGVLKAIDSELRKTIPHPARSARHPPP